MFERGGTQRKLQNVTDFCVPPRISPLVHLMPLKFHLGMQSSYCNTRCNIMIITSRNQWMCLSLGKPVKHCGAACDPPLHSPPALEGMNRLPPTGSRDYTASPLNYGSNLIYSSSQKEVNERWKLCCIYQNFCNIIIYCKFCKLIFC